MIQLLGGPQLLGLGAEPVSLFLATNPSPSSAQVADFLKAYPEHERGALAQELIARGVEARTVSSALKWLHAVRSFRASWPTIAGIAALASASVSAYHGGKRNNGSIAWAAWWFLMGTIFPVFTPVVAVVQGFAKPKKAS